MNWQSRWYPASGRLTGILEGVWAVAADGRHDLIARVVPDNSVCLVFQRRDTELKTCDNNWSTWREPGVSGPRTQPFAVSLAGGSEVLIVQLTAIGAGRLLKTNLCELTDAHVPLGAILGQASNGPPSTDELSQSVPNAIQAVEDWIAVETQDVASSEAVHAFTSLVNQRNGDVAIEEVARTLGVSRRHLSRLAAEHLGYSPKRFASISRFQHALNLLRQGTAAPIGMVAAATGYADQAHMTRNFRAIGSIAPGDLLGPDALTIW